LIEQRRTSYHQEFNVNQQSARPYLSTTRLVQAYITINRALASIVRTDGELHVLELENGAFADVWATYLGDGIPPSVFGHNLAQALGPLEQQLIQSSDPGWIDQALFEAQRLASNATAGLGAVARILALLETTGEEVQEAGEPSLTEMLAVWGEASIKLENALIDRIERRARLETAHGNLPLET
jgi:hypothetical protein